MPALNCYPTNSMTQPSEATVPAKYPRTPHLPFSPGPHRDDRVLVSCDALLGVDLVLTEKLDGSNVCLTADDLFARSHSTAPSHPSFAPLWPLYQQVRQNIPSNVSVFAEWCFAVHAITYPDLPRDRWLNVFAVRFDDTRRWASHDDVLAMCEHLDLAPVPTDRRASVATPTDLERLVLDISDLPSAFGPTREGVVVRAADGFPDDQFASHVAKWVRAGHVAGEHWTRRTPTPHN